MEPITNPNQLPVRGCPETNSLEFKARYKKSTTPPFSGYELGKDVAALANAMGGTILVGAQEVASALDGYAPLSETDANETIHAVEQAVRDRCSPSPVVSQNKVPLDVGFVVAINVSPFPGQPVGVRLRSDRTEGHGGDAWTFPVRIGTQTKFFRPEQLAMLMSAEYRRIAILLNEIKPGDEVLLTTPNRGHGSEMKCSFQSSSALDNILVLPSKERGVGTFRIPIDRVRSVWRDGSWYILIDGHFGQGANGLVFWA